MAVSGFRKFLGGPGLKVGSAIFEFDVPGIGHLLKQGGAEFAFVDLEHSGLDISSLKRILRYCEAAGLPALVRPPSKAYHHVARVLDVGADGVMLPMVGTAEEAGAILRGMKYAPVGERGVALGIAHDGYAPGPVQQKLADANASRAMIALIETAEGIDNVDEIAAVDGLDALWIGHFDLSCSLGIPGEFEHERFLSAVEKVIAAAKAHGRALGRLAGSAEEGAGLYKQGFDLICYSGDLWLLQGALSAGISAMREACR